MWKSIVLWLALLCAAAVLALPCAAQAQGFGGGTPPGGELPVCQAGQSPPSCVPGVTIPSPIPFQPSVSQPFSPINSAGGMVCPVDGLNLADANGNPVVSGLVSRIVICVHDTMLWAVESFLVPLAGAMSGSIAAACVLAVALFGLKIITGGVQRITAEGVQFGIKLAAVIIFTANFANYFPSIIAVMDYLVQTASSYFIFSQQNFDCLATSGTKGVDPYSAALGEKYFSISPWVSIDCVLDRLIGGIMPAAPGTTDTLASGVLGFLVGCIFSGPAGFALFLAGIAFLFVILLALFKAMYMYLICFIGLCFLACLSPLFIPLILFKVTHQYFEKWLRMLIGLILQPMFMFAYLSLLLAALDIVIFSGPLSFYADIAGQAAGQPGFYIGNYMCGKDCGSATPNAYTTVHQGQWGNSLDPRALIAGTGANPNGNGDYGVMGDNLVNYANKQAPMPSKTITAQQELQAINMPLLASEYYGVTVNCDSKPQQNCSLLTSYIVQIMMALLTAGVVAYIFYVMLGTVPYLATALTGGTNPDGSSAMPDLGRFMDKHMEGFRQQLSGGKPAGAEGKQASVGQTLGLG